MADLDLDLDTLEALAKAATLTPGRVDVTRHGEESWHKHGTVTLEFDAGDRWVEMETGRTGDAEVDARIEAQVRFLAAACNAALPLVAEVRRLRAEVARLEREVDDAVDRAEQRATFEAMERNR